MTASAPRVFGVDYQFLACGDVFTQGLAHAAAELGVPYAHAECRTPGLGKLVAAFHPDLVLVVHGRQVGTRWPTEFTGLRTAVWLLDEPYEVDDTSRWSSRFTHVFVNDPATLDRHPGSQYLPVCYDPLVHTPADGDRPYQVGFIGGGNRIRNGYLDALAQAGVLSYVIGGDWASPRVRALTVSRNVAPRETAARYQATRIILNVFREQHHFNRLGVVATSMNPRIYEALACGALVVSEWRPEIASAVPDLPTFTTERECVALVRHLLAHPDDAEVIRLRCAMRLNLDTYAQRLRTVLDATCGAVGVAA